MKQLLLSALLVALAAFPLAAAEPSNEIDPETVLALMNEERAAAGVSPLGLEPRLMSAANDRMRHMEDEGYWSHESPEGQPPFLWIAAQAYSYQYAGENLATGFETARLLVTSWMESPGHRANILSPNFTDCGIAVIEGSTTGPATGRSIVVLFARELPIPTIAILPPKQQRQSMEIDGRGVRRH